MLHYITNNVPHTVMSKPSLMYNINDGCSGHTAKDLGNFIVRF